MASAVTCSNGMSPTTPTTTSLLALNPDPLTVNGVFVGAGSGDTLKEVLVFPLSIGLPFASDERDLACCIEYAVTARAPSKRIARTIFRICENL